MGKKKEATAAAGTEGAAAPAPAAPKPAKITQNGITRPASAGKTGRIFDIADKLSEAAGKPVGRADVLKAAEAEGINPATAATQYGRWRKFHGLKGRGTEEEAAPAPAPVVEPAAAAPAAE